MTKIQKDKDKNTKRKDQDEDTVPNQSHLFRPFLSYLCRVYFESHPPEGRDVGEKNKKQMMYQKKKRELLTLTPALNLTLALTLSLILILTLNPKP
jgi:hypothetical protein